jgi:hypothetical protein
VVWPVLVASPAGAASYFREPPGALPSPQPCGGSGCYTSFLVLAHLEGDGDLDVYMPGGYGLDADKLFRQTSPGAFVDEAAARLPNGLTSRAGAAHFGDVDGDGDWGDAPLGSPSRVRPGRRSRGLATSRGRCAAGGDYPRRKPFG